jgi:hypothetical protein
MRTVRHGFQQVNGSFGFELSLASYDDWLAALLGSTWQTITLGSTGNLGVGSTSTFTRASGSFVTDLVYPGDIITTTGFTNANNNGNFTVTGVSATTLTVGVTSLTTESATSGRSLTVPGHRLSVGTTLTTFTVERQFLDVALYQPMRGVAANKLSLSIKPDAIIGGTMDVIGMSAAIPAGSTIASSLTAAPTHDPLTSFQGVLYEGTNLMGAATGVDVSVDNGRTVSPVIGQNFSLQVFDGMCKVTGTLTAILQDASLLTKFVNETNSSLYLCMDDDNGTDFQSMVLPNLKYNTGSMDPPATGPVPQSLNFEGIYDLTSATTIRFQKSN